MKLHVGCGPCYIKGMFNIDTLDNYKTDYCGSFFDLAKREHPQYISESSVELIWSCHMLEHLPYPKGVTKGLLVFYKWLKPRGILRLAVPDLELVARYYVEKDLKIFRVHDYKYFYKPDSFAERFTFFMREWRHTVIFDFDLLKSLLVDAGFGSENIVKMKPGESRLDSWSHDRMEIETLFLEAQK